MEKAHNKADCRPAKGSGPGACEHLAWSEDATGELFRSTAEVNLNRPAAQQG